jgi:hypothetical protein
MSRLFTFGCSFTNWNWPTWADLLAEGYDYYENWGFAGLGNRAIAERVAEAFVTNNFNENDTVIIQWSSHLRNDYAKTRSVDVTGGMWQTKGSVVSPTNQHLYNEAWFRNFWDEKAYYLHTLNNIVLVQQLLKSCKCKWYMTSITDLQNITLSSESTDPKFPTTNVLSLDSSLLSYKENIWDQNKDSWLPPLIEEKWGSSELDWTFVVDPADKTRSVTPITQFKNNKMIEPHLTPKQSANYLRKVADRLNFNQTRFKEVDELAVYFEDMYAASNHNWEDFMAYLCSDPWAHQKNYKGR